MLPPGGFQVRGHHQPHNHLPPEVTEKLGEKLIDFIRELFGKKQGM
jgi:hypothetical protein